MSAFYIVVLSWGKLDLRMKKNITYLKTNWWIIFLVVFSLVSLLAETASGRWNMIDLEVYVRTAQRMVSGEELYRIASDGHYVYKYAPTAAFLFIPLTLMPFWLAKFIFWAGLTFLLGITLKTIKVQSEPFFSSELPVNKLAVFLSILTILIHLHSELHLGQVNLPLLVIYCFAMFSFVANRQVLFSFLIAISIFIKPFGLIFIPYLILKKRYKTVAYFFGFVAVLFLLPLIFYPSIDQFMVLNKAWLNELSIELGYKQDLFADKNHTIFSVLARYTPLKFLLGGNVLLQKAFQLIVLGGIGFSFYKYERKRSSVLVEMSILMALIPLLAFTSKNAFLFSMPLAFYMIAQFKAQDKVSKVLTVLGCFFIGGNLYEVYGATISMFLTEVSIYAFGSIILLIVCYMSRNKPYLISNR